MGLYLNPALGIKEKARSLPPSLFYDNLIAEMVPGERLFILAKRGDHWQCFHARDRQVFSEYCFVADVDSYWAMDDYRFTEEFDWATGEYHRQEDVLDIHVEYWLDEKARVAIEGIKSERRETLRSASNAGGWKCPFDETPKPLKSFVCAYWENQDENIESL